MLLTECQNPRILYSLALNPVCMVQYKYNPQAASAPCNKNYHLYSTVIMQRYLSSVLDVHESYRDGFLALVDKHTALLEHIVRLGEVNLSFDNYLEGVLAQFIQANGIIGDLELLCFHDQYVRFIAECENLMASIAQSAQQIRELSMPIDNTAMDPNETEAAPVDNPDNAPDAEGQGDVEQMLVQGSEPEGQGDVEQMLAQGSEPEGQREQSSEDHENLHSLLRQLFDMGLEV